MARRKSSRITKKPKRTKRSRELVVTLNASSDDIAKVEELVSAGKRRTVSESDLATLAGDDVVDDLCEVFEAAYMAGVRDGLEDALRDDGPARESRAREVAQVSAGEEILRAGLRRTILRRALRRNLERAHETTHHNGAHDPP